MTQFTSPWKLLLKYLKVCRWAAMHDERFQARHFWIPIELEIRRHYYYSRRWVIYIGEPSFQDPFSEEIHKASGVWTRDELERFFFNNDIPF